MLTFLYIILFILFIFYIFNFEDDTDIEIKDKKIVNNNSLVNNSANIIPITTNFNVIEPQFRGLLDYIKIQDKKENGGSDPFKNNNINIIDTTNEVNYTNYNSYRIKPLVQDH